MNVSGLDSLVVGIDESAHAAAALRWAISSTAEEGSIEVVHAVPPASMASVMTGPIGGLGLSAVESDRVSHQSKALELLEGAWTDEARGAGANIHTHLVEGGPADSLLGVAYEKQSAAVVVGAHGNHGRRHFLGNVSRRLLQRSAIPTVVVRADPGEVLRGTVPGSARSDPDRRGLSVVACVGYGEATEGAAHWAASYASSAGLPLTLIHVVGYRPVFPADPPEVASDLGQTAGQNWAMAELDRLRAAVNARLPELQISTKVDAGFAAREVERASASAALIVLGKRHSTANRTAISPQVHRLLTRSVSPVAVVPSRTPCP